jgi:hypothetical protein
LISPWPLEAAPKSIEAGAAVFHVSGKSQHAGIAATDGSVSAPLSVYAVASRSDIVETWNSLSRWQVSVVGLVGTEPSRRLLALAQVLRECDRVRSLVADSMHSGATHACCWQIVDPYRLVEDDASSTIIFTGSCAGFVEHCYEVAGIDIVDEGALPVSSYSEGEASYIQGEYDRAGGGIARLYPSYQIRAFQLDEFPWNPDLAFRWFPEQF